MDQVAFEELARAGLLKQKPPHPGFAVGRTPGALVKPDHRLLRREERAQDRLCPKFFG